MMSFRNKLSLIIMKLTLSVMPVNQRQWARAMCCEFQHIENKTEALIFVMGCFFAAWRYRMITDKYEPVLRWTMLISFLIWGSAKLYLLTKITLEPIQDLTLLLSAAAYWGCGVSLFKKKWPAYCICFVAALLINSAHVIWAMTLLNDVSIMSLAIISEEYFIWTLSLLGSALIWILNNHDYLERRL